MSYVINIDSQWMWCPTMGKNTATVNIANVTFNNFMGTTNSGRNRGSIHARTHHATPAIGVEFSNIAAWDPAQGSLIQHCENVYGAGECALPDRPSAGGTSESKTKIVTLTNPPLGFRYLETPAWALTKPYAPLQEIPFSAAPDPRVLFARMAQEVSKEAPMPAVTNPAKKIGIRNRHGHAHHHK